MFSSSSGELCNHRLFPVRENYRILDELRLPVKNVWCLAA
jgi:hypothetical protein